MVMTTEITFGQLRTQLKSTNARWSIGPAKADSEVVPTHHLGGRIDNLVLREQARPIDFAKLLAVPPTNPLLNERRRALNLPAQKQVRSFPVLHGITAGPPVGGSGGAPAVVDWRNRGWPWLCTVQNQVGENCWAMAATALVETMVRINHGVWSKRSEGDVHDGMGAHIDDGGSAQAALDWIKTHGLTDWDDYPTQAKLPYVTAPDRGGRTVKIGDYTVIGDIAQQKQWLDAVGPLITWFDVWHDFDAFYNTPDSAVYHWQEYLSPGVKNYERGGHFMLVVGYDDHLGCWICRNSWGSNFGHDGYIRVAYGDAHSGIDKYARIGLSNTNPDPWTKRRLHNGGMIESGDGAAHRNFELMALAANHSVVHWWRDGSSLAWAKEATLANDAASFPTLTGTTYNRNFEFIYRTTGNRLHHWFFDQASNSWKDGGIFGPADADGTPAFLQSNFGEPGNFEVVVKTKDGRLAHWWRINGSPWTWKESARFGSDIAASGPTLVQSHYAKSGNLELVAARTDGRMQHFWRDDIGGTGWHAGVIFGVEVGSAPVMIEGQYGAGNENAIGNFELCVAVNGRVQHWWRNNQGGGIWSKSAEFGSNVRSVIALLEGSFGFDLEVVVERADAQLQHYWRDGGGWHAGPIIGPTV
ncbi:peptidase C1A [Pseudoduganella eburnea]|uniref:Peptidase C1A n=2 Tax=Massilia eburnea TaxID=1776165 RepID=A0A6L6QI83_9BURK|nr:peptidase C1A [Massilia eburnea]